MPSKLPIAFRNRGWEETGALPKSPCLHSGTGLKIMFLPRQRCRQPSTLQRSLLETRALDTALRLPRPVGKREQSRQQR